MSLKNFRKEMICVLGLIACSVAMMILGTTHTLDIEIYYSQEEAREFFAQLSPLQSRAYFINEIFDLGFLACYSGILYFLSARTFPRDKWPRQLALVPGFFDIVENLSILGVLGGFLSEPPVWLGAITFAKWISAVLILAMLGIGQLV